MDTPRPVSGGSGIDVDDTIAAVASAPGGAARGIVRLSGSRVRDVLRACFTPTAGDSLDAVRTAQVVSGTLELSGSPLALEVDVYYWPDARSYTRQPTAEIHLIGSPPLVESVLQTVCVHGCRGARRGEFTLRAFLAQRLDLTQAEAVLGVIDAVDEQELQCALRQLGGGLATPLAALRSDLLDVLAEIEAALDFADEDLEFIAPDDVRRVLQRALAEVEVLMLRLQVRQDATELPRVVLVGSPNAGKSQLFNALVGHDAAIVSPLAGTTRDYLTARLSLGDIECQLIDTAGVDELTQGIEAAAQRATQSQRGDAHVELLCLDASQPLDERSRRWLQAMSDTPRLIVWTKADLPSVIHQREPGMNVCALDGRGLDALRQQLRQRLFELRSSGESVVAGTAARCQQSLQSASVALREALLQFDVSAGEMVAAEIRLVLDALGEVAGVVCADDVLDRIFSRFCIGK